MSTTKDNYTEYLNSSLWEDKKTIVKKIYKDQNWPIACVKCGTKLNLNIHHNYYPFDLDNTNICDLDYLCSTCHKKWHSIIKRNLFCVGQNFVIKYNFEFYLENKNYWQKEEILDLLNKKIEEDEKNITTYFLESTVINYEEYIKNQDLRTGLFVLSWFLLIIWIGLLIALLTFIFVKKKQEVKKPWNYDLFIERKHSLERKKVIVSGLIFENNR